MTSTAGYSSTRPSVLPASINRQAAAALPHHCGSFRSGTKKAPVARAPRIHRKGLVEEVTMPQAAACPDLGDLQRFVLGQTAEADAERLEGHLTQCPACIGALATLHGQDTLVDAVRGQAKAVTEPEHATVTELIARLQDLKP